MSVMALRMKQSSSRKSTDVHLQRLKNMLWNGPFVTVSCPEEALKMLNCTENDLNHNKAWMFMMSRKLKYQDEEEVAFQGCSALTSLMCNIDGLRELLLEASKELTEEIIRDNMMQILASCCLHLAAKMASSENITNLCDYIRMMKLWGDLPWTSMSQIEKLVFIFLCHHPFENVSPLKLFFELKKACDIHFKLHDKPFTEEITDVESNFCKVILKTIYCNSKIETIPLAVGIMKFLVRQYFISQEEMLITEKRIDSLLDVATVNQSNKVVKDVYGILLIETSNSKSIKSMMEGLLPHADSITAALSAVKLNALTHLNGKN